MNLSSGEISLVHPSCLHASPRPVIDTEQISTVKEVSAFCYCLCHLDTVKA